METYRTFVPDQSQAAIVLIGNERFCQDCIAHALQIFFPKMDVVNVHSNQSLADASEAIKDKEPVLTLLRCTVDAGSPEVRTQAETIIRIFPKASLILLAPCEDLASIKAAVAMGASGVIPLTAPLKVAAAALHLVLAGGTCYPGPVPACNPRSSRPTTEIILEEHPLRQRETQASSANAGVNFSPRELEVLGALGRGRSNKAIAYELQLSENTVKAYISQIMRKLRATNRTQAAMFAHKFADDGGIAH